MNIKERMYYVEYSRNMHNGARLSLLAVWTAEKLSEYLLEYSPRYNYIVHLARIATQEEIDRFLLKE